MTRWPVLAAFILLPLSAVAAPVPEAGPALNRVPASAPVVVHLRGVEGALDRFFVFAKNAVPDLAPLGRGFVDGWLRDGVDGRKLRGLAKDGPHFFVLLDTPKPGAEPPKMAMLASVTNYRDFRDNILKEEERKSLKVEAGYESAALERGEAIFFVDKKDYAVITPQKDVAVAFTKKQAGLDTKISKEQAAKLLTVDLGVYAQLDTLNKAYAEQIKQAREFIDQTIKAAQDGAGGNPTRQDKVMFDLGIKVIAAAFQAVEDSQGLLLTAEFRPEAIAWHLQSELRRGTTTSTALADSKPAAFTELADLPARRVFYMGQKLGPTISKALGGLVLGMLPDGSDEGKALNAALEAIHKAGPGVRLDAVGLPVDGVQLWTFEDPAAALETQLKLLATLKPGGSFEPALLKEAPTVTKNAEKLDGLGLTRVDFMFDLDKMGEAFGPQLPEEARKKVVEGFKKLLGEKRSIWIGADAKQIVRVTAADWTAAKKLLADRQGKGAVGAAAAFRAARKELPAETNYLAFIDVVPYAVGMLEMVKPFLPINPPALPADGNPGFVGFALTLNAERSSFDLVVTSTAVKRSYEFAAIVRQGVGGGR